MWGLPARPRPKYGRPGHPADGAQQEGVRMNFWCGTAFMSTPELPAVGRMPEEYELLGQDFASRGRRLDEMMLTFTGGPRTSASRD